MASEEISTALVKDLRDRTGISVGKCKEALQEAKGDIELAIANLRKAGMANAVKKEGRETKEGIIKSGEDAKNVALLEVNAETDFVVKNERFQQFTEELVGALLQGKPTTLEAFLAQKSGNATIEEMRVLLVQTLGENLKIRRFHLFPKGANRSIGVYSHSGGKLVTLCELEGATGQEAVAREVAMHIAAEAPEYLSPEGVPEHVRAQEREIARAQCQDKPAQIQEKIIEGKVKAFYDQVCLLHQKFIKDPQLTVAQWVEKQKSGLKVVQFVRWRVGE